MLDLQPYINALDWITPVEMRGRVTALVGLLIRAAMPRTHVGELCLIRSRRNTKDLRAEVVGFQSGETILMPLGEIQDVAMGAEVIPTGTSLSVKVGQQLLGRVLDGLGVPTDGYDPILSSDEYPVTSQPPAA
jgi:flagellar biosynthesis/type III secretory pathway ATPase